MSLTVTETVRLENVLVELQGLERDLTNRTLGSQVTASRLEGLHNCIAALETLWIAKGRFTHAMRINTVLKTKGGK